MKAPTEEQRLFILLKELVEAMNNLTDRVVALEQLAMGIEPEQGPEKE